MTTMLKWCYRKNSAVTELIFFEKHYAVKNDCYRIDRYRIENSSFETPWA